METFLNLNGFRKLPLIRQVEAAECGLACIGMVASYHGYVTDLATLRREHPISMKGSTLKEVMEIASQLGLGSRPVRCELNELKDLRAPSILHWDLDHFVVLRSANRKRVIVHDPARGRLVRRLHDISPSFTGVALELSPTPRFQRRREKQPVRLSSLVRLDGAAWQALLQGLVLSVLLQVFVLASPYFMQLVIDEAILKLDLSLLAAVAGGFALLKLFEVATTILRGLVFQFLSNVISFDMKASLFHHLMRLPLGYFHRRHVGDIQQRFQSLQPITAFVVNGAIAALIDGVLAALIGAMLFLYNVQLALIATGALALYAALRWGFLELSKRLAGDLLVAQAKESSRFLETLRAIQTIKVAANETAREAVWRNLTADAMNATIRVGNANIAYASISQAILGLSTILVVYVAATHVIGGAMTVGMITAFLAYKGQLEQRLTALIEQYVSWRLLDVHLERVADIALHDREPSIDAPLSERQLSGQVDLVDVRFRYAPHEPEILSGVTATIRPGEYVAITGASGCGKSTLLKVLTGLYQPTGGEVLFDGLPSHALGPQTIRQQIGVVMQDDVLLAGSIAENIALFDEQIDMRKVESVARIACIHDHIERMPMGYRSLVGDMGSTLSAGQKQRVMIARALYRDPNILVLDEGTSNLDIETERAVNAALKELAITRIVVAHRPDTIRSAARVLQLSANGLVKHSHERLGIG